MSVLDGIKVIEMGGIGPCPFAGMMLADMGADVVIIERPVASMIPKSKDINRRGKSPLSLNLKDEKDKSTLKKLIAEADILIEGYRPGVMESLGLGPQECHEINPRLVYGRMTGWGQDGPLAHTAGHDINYISITGVLEAIGQRGQKPSVPLNLVGDYGGGAMMLLVGILSAQIEAMRSGKGQVVDAAMTDGSAALMSLFHTMSNVGTWAPRRGSNLLDSGAPFYDVYETKDNKYVAIGAIEPQFYAILMQKLGLETESIANEQMDITKWSAHKTIIADQVKTKTRDEWAALCADSDACLSPVLSMSEASGHEHNIHRDTYITGNEGVQPAPAPKYSRTPSSAKSISKENANVEEIHARWAVDK